MSKKLKITRFFKTYPILSKNNEMEGGRNIPLKAIEWDVYRLEIKAIGYEETSEISDCYEEGAGGLTESHTPSVNGMQWVGDTMSRKENNNCKNISTKKKVWTLLKNGLYGWRVTKKGGRRSRCDDILKAGDGRVPPSAQAVFLEVPAGFEKTITVGSNNLMPGKTNKRKFNFGGNDYKVGAISELGGEVSDPDLKTMRLDFEELPM